MTTPTPRTDAIVRSHDDLFKHAQQLEKELIDKTEILDRLCAHMGADGPVDAVTVWNSLKSRAEAWEKCAGGLRDYINSRNAPTLSKAIELYTQLKIK